MRGCLTKVSGGALLLLVFGLVAAFIWRDSATSPVVLEQPEAAKNYAAAWVDGALDKEDYDPSGGPDVKDGDASLIADNVEWMVRGISDADQDRPIKVDLAGPPRPVSLAQGELRPGDQIQAMEVTWDLGRQKSWTYRTEVVVRETDGRERVLWRPNAVHPQLTHGLILVAKRVRSERAPVLDATEHHLAAGAAAALVGTTQKATHELAETYPDRVVAGDVIGISGLQHVYDAQLAGTAGIEIDVVRDKNYKPLEPAVRPVHVVPPVPGKPLRLTLDPGWQARADAAVSRAPTPTAVVALDSLTGRVLAAATGGADREVALQGPYPPGAAFRIATMLALARQPGTTEKTAANCTPLLFDNQRFDNAPGVPSSATSTLGTAFAENCRTGLARAARTLTSRQLVEAAEDLGIGVSNATGASSYDGIVPAATDQLGVVQNALGEGSVLTSPLAMARAAATVASGTRRPAVLVAPTTRTTPDPPQKTLEPGPQALLQKLMAASVAADPQLEALQSTSLGGVGAVAGMAGYGPARTAPVHAWCVGYQGTVAFAVLITGTPGSAPTGTYPARHAAELAAALLG